MRRIILVCLPLSVLLGGSLPARAFPIEWTPRKLLASVAQGDSTVRVVSFTSRIALTDVVVSVVPELQPFVSTHPSSFDVIEAGQTVELVLTVSAPLASPLGSFDGTLKLRRDSGRSRQTFAKPLPIIISVTEATPFEEFGSWNMADPALMGFAVEPERAGPGDAITLRATVANVGTGALSSPDMVFYLDDAEIARVPVGALGPGEEKELTATWTAAGPGRHVYLAELELDDGDFDRTHTNNSLTAVAFSSGEADPTPDLVLGEVDLGLLQLSASESVSIPVTVRNPSFATISDVPVFYLVDGEQITPPGSDRIGLPNAILDLVSGEDVDLAIPWNDVTPGDHVITLAVNLPDTFPDVESKRLNGWCAVVPDETVLYQTPLKNQWASIGPRSLTGVPNWPHTHFGKTGNVGRMDRIAFHPTDPNTIYGGSPAGGLWKTTNAGGSWTPLGDKWPSMQVGAVAVDPQHPQIVYVATGSAAHGGGEGLFKSLDGGKTWHVFASKAVAEGASQLVIRYPSPGTVLIYAGSNRGVLRYVSNDPWATTSTPAEWLLLKQAGLLTDMAVSPNDDSLVYAAVSKRAHSPKLGRTIDQFVGVYRTRYGATAVDENDAQWTLVSTGLPSPGTGEPLDHPALVKLDIYRGDPKTLYAAVLRPQGGDGAIGTDLPFLGIYQTITEGDSWFLRENVYENNGFIDFIRVHPVKSQVIYYGGVHFFTRNLASEGGPKHIDQVHDDVKFLEFDPATAGSGFDHYYVLTDGGIWRCKVDDDPACVPRNNELRVTMFFDLDPSPASPNLMIGGTQDNGTLLYEGSPEWKILRGGDGDFAAIASDQVFYSQHQGFTSMGRCDNGVGCGWADWTDASKGLPNQSMGNAQFAVYPNPTMPYTLASQGPSVFFTGNGGVQWDPRGPKGATLEPAGAVVRGSVSRVLVGLDFILAGTSHGQIWQTALAGTTWHLLYEHPSAANINSMSLAPVGPTESKVLFATLTSGDATHRSVLRLVRDPFDWLDWSAENITSDFPATNCSPDVVSADGYTADKVYVGTKSGVYRGEFNGSFWFWRPFNDGLPLARVTDLVLAANRELRAATYGRGAWSVVTGPDIE